MNSKRTVLITGASRGLGAQLALEFAIRGNQVIGLYKNSDAEAEMLSRKIKEMSGRGEFFKVDISKLEEVKFFFSHFEEKWKTLDLLINNAAITRDALVVSMTMDQWDDVLKVNLKGAFFCMKEAACLMKNNIHRTNERTSKSIMNVVSLVGAIGGRGQANYAASKAALMALTRVAALEFGCYGISVNAIIPGLLQTKMSKGTERDKGHPARPLSVIAESIIFMSQLNTSGQIYSLEDRITSYAALR